MQTIIPTKIVGPFKIISPEFKGEIKAPLATFESPLWFSVNRGARVTKDSGGIKSIIIQDGMTRSILVEADEAAILFNIVNELQTHRKELEKVASGHSRFTKLKDWHTQIVGNLLYLRFTFSTGAAAGHNMATLAAENLQQWLLKKYNKLKYVSISGNYCADKKCSAVNGILGRGKYVVAESLIDRKICIEKLRATPEEIVALNIKKNLLGSIIAGSVRSANAHYANMLLAFYLALGQDAANIVEGSQGFTYAETREGDLYFSVTLPNIIVGSIAATKGQSTVQANLDAIRCLKEDDPDFNSRCLAIITGAIVLCGELSLLAAQANIGELMQAHLKIERKK
jgi:hydroxymethylglutaryl-CoA reductase (NADPH)